MPTLYTTVVRPIVTEKSSAAVQGRVPLLIDSGVRRGADILKARARGAAAVAIGRPALFGAAVAGERGVRRVLEILTEELRLCMKLSGTPTLPCTATARLPSARSSPRSVSASSWLL